MSHVVVVFFCTGQFVVGNKISFGRTPFVRLSIDTLDFACEKHNKSNTYSGG